MNFHLCNLSFDFETVFRFFNCRGNQLVTLTLHWYHESVTCTMKNLLNSFKGLNFSQTYCAYCHKERQRIVSVQRLTIFNLQETALQLLDLSESYANLFQPVSQVNQDVASWSEEESLNPDCTIPGRERWCYPSSSLTLGVQCISRLGGTFLLSWSADQDFSLHLFRTFGQKTCPVLLLIFVVKLPKPLQLFSEGTGATGAGNVQVHTVHDQQSNAFLDPIFKQLP